MKRKVIIASVVALLFSNSTFAMIELSALTPESAQKLGVEIETREYGKEMLWVTVRFKKEGDMAKITPERFGRVSFRLMEGDQPILMMDVADRSRDPKRVESSFMLRRSDVERVEVWIAYGGGLMEGLAYEMKLNDFVD